MWPLRWMGVWKSCQLSSDLSDRKDLREEHSRWGEQLVRVVSADSGERCDWLCLKLLGDTRPLRRGGCIAYFCYGPVTGQEKCAGTWTNREKEIIKNRGKKNARNLRGKRFCGNFGPTN